MRLVTTLFLISVAFGLGVVGCDGGGGGSSDTSQLTPQSREQEFVEEAVQRVLDRAFVACTSVFCSGDSLMHDGIDTILGTISAMCQYRCMPVEIDVNEVRHYWVWLAWRRISSTCFEPDEFDILLAAQVPVPCEPTQ